MKITVPELSVVVLIGPSGAGKSTFARRHFKPTEVLSSDFCRGLVSDDENDQAATNDAFDVLHFIAAKRLAAGKLTVVDATNVQEEARKPLVRLARDYHCLPVALVFNLPEGLCQERNRERPDRDFGPHVIRGHVQQLRRSLRGLRGEGFRYIYVLSSPEEVEAVTIERQPLWNNRKEERGPFDIIGDVHGCFEELQALLGQLGYEIQEAGEGPEGPRVIVQPPAGRKAVFVGDLVDRGPQIPAVLRLVMGMVEDGSAFCVPGNHDVKLLRKLQGKNVQVTHGLADSLEQLEQEAPEFQARVRAFLDSLVSHYVLDDGRLVVAHAGLREEMQGRGSAKVRDFALYGETTGETDEFGLPVRYNWASEYRGRAMVVYGHTPIPEPEWLNNTINIDTGCVFGGRLTALRYPERELVSVAAAHTYCEPVRPFLSEEDRAPALTAQQRQDDVLDVEDVLGKRLISTRLQRNITIREGNAITALEVMSRFAADPKWLIYLPPTMSPSETSRQPGLLEHPAEAFAHYRHEGVPRVVCQEKHMGSRGVVIACRDAGAARRRFGVVTGESGICYTRTGRPFFTDAALEAALLAEVRAALDRAGTWEEFRTDWVCLDCELMPWSAKAQELLRLQYAAVGSAARAALPEVVAALDMAAARGVPLEIDPAPPEAGSNGGPEGEHGGSPLRERYRERAEMAERYVAAYRRYCWPVESLNDLQLAPFHLLATEGAVHVDRDHVWHMETLARICGDEGGRGDGETRRRGDAETGGRGEEGKRGRGEEETGDRQPSQHPTPNTRHPLPSVLRATPYRVVDVTDPESQEAGIRWWEELTGRGGEGMVVKPLDFVARGRRGIVQPAVKCRGREYLRIIYGPEYTAPEHLERLRSRGLAVKRSLALREFALGIEALERFARREPLYRVHECVFGVLALESEPVDPRL